MFERLVKFRCWTLLILNIIRTARGMNLSEMYHKYRMDIFDKDLDFVGYIHTMEEEELITRVGDQLHRITNKGTRYLWKLSHSHKAIFHDVESYIPEYQLSQRITHIEGFISSIAILFIVLIGGKRLAEAFSFLDVPIVGLMLVAMVLFMINLVRIFYQFLQTSTLSSGKISSFVTDYPRLVFMLETIGLTVIGVIILLVLHFSIQEIIGGVLIEMFILIFMKLKKRLPDNH